MEDIRSYRNDHDETHRTIAQDDDTLRLDRRDFGGSSKDDEVPFHIPRD